MWVATNESRDGKLSALVAPALIFCARLSLHVQIIYFGYGSNLWQHQIHLRCPTSEYIGIARLDNYRWMINDRRSKLFSYSNVVYGLVYSLQPSDEDELDINEGAPFAYNKESLLVLSWAMEEEGGPIDTHKHAKKQEMLVYIDRRRFVDDRSKYKYIHSTNMDIHAAIKEGVPVDYVQEVIRKFISSEETTYLTNRPCSSPPRTGYKLLPHNEV
ncbi:hypothetical protein E4T39_06660 [Aureobasidium subglaciale]|nr:hypothetical protein E4T39_06660 [Aureobasidium subglaciale]